jgi:hypothetical protein
VPREPSAVAVGGSPGVFPFAPWRHRLSLLLVASTLALIFVGGLVTSTGSGLSVPDWPLSYGMVMPPMVGGVFFEHGHRMVASGVGFLTLVLAVWTARAEGRASLRRLAWVALAAVIAQGVLGGLTVIYLLPTPISVTHACLAQAFFCITIALAYLTSREWLASTTAREDVAGVRGAAVAATAVVPGSSCWVRSWAHRGRPRRTDFRACTDAGSRPPSSSSKCPWLSIWLIGRAPSSCWPSSCAWPCAPRVTATGASLAPPRSRWGWCSRRSAWAR